MSPLFSTFLHFSNCPHRRMNIECLYLINMQQKGLTVRQKLTTAKTSESKTCPSLTSVKSWWLTWQWFRWCYLDCWTYKKGLTLDDIFDRNGKSWKIIWWNKWIFHSVPLWRHDTAPRNVLNFDKYSWYCLWSLLIKTWIAKEQKSPCIAYLINSR